MNRRISTSEMLRPLLAITAIMYCLPSWADLGGADITGPSGATSTGQTYEARCGIKKEECSVSLTGEKLTVNGVGGIFKKQLIGVKLKKECNQRSLLFPWVTSCFQNQLDWEFTITYTADTGERRSAVISFMPRYFATGATDRARNFERDLEVWMQDILRPIGPTLKIEAN